MPLNYIVDRTCIIYCIYCTRSISIVTVPGIQVPYTPYLGRTARGQVIISTRLEPLKPRPQPGGAEQGLDLRDYSTLGVTICWLLWGVILPMGWDIFPTAFQLVAANYPIPRTLLGLYKLGDCSGIAFWALHYN